MISKQVLVDGFRKVASVLLELCCSKKQEGPGLQHFDSLQVKVSPQGETRISGGNDCFHCPGSDREGRYSRCNRISHAVRRLRRCFFKVLLKLGKNLCRLGHRYQLGEVRRNLEHLANPSAVNGSGSTQSAP